MSYGYGGGPNPFDDRNTPAPAYGAPSYNAPPQNSYGQGPRPGGAPRYDQQNSSSVEMSSLAQDPNAILNECRSIDQGIDKIEQNLNQLRMLQDRSLNETDTSGSTTSRQLDSLSSETMAMYRQLTERVRQAKSQREAQQPKNAPQIGRVDRRLKQAIQQFQQVESAFRKKTQEQMARQYRIVKPDASESEVRAVVEDTSGGQQIFQQAMMQSDRRGQARAVLNSVQDRHAALQKIEQQMVELAQLFQDMDTLVVQQNEQVMSIEQKGEEVVEALDKGNQEIGVAIQTARKTRRKKWICLGICVAIVVIIAIAVAIYVVVTKPGGGGGGKKRDLEIRGLEALDERAPILQVHPAPEERDLGVDKHQSVPITPPVSAFANSKFVLKPGMPELPQSGHHPKFGKREEQAAPVLGDFRHKGGPLASLNGLSQSKIVLPKGAEANQNTGRFNIDSKGAKVERRGFADLHVGNPMAKGNSASSEAKGRLQSGGLDLGITKRDEPEPRGLADALPNTMTGHVRAGEKRYVIIDHPEELGSSSEKRGFEDAIFHEVTPPLDLNLEENA